MIGDEDARLDHGEAISSVRRDAAKEGGPFHRDAGSVESRKFWFMWAGLSAGLRCPGEEGPARSIPSAARP